MDTINDRMEILVNSYFDGNKSRFAKAIGLAPTAISGYLGKQRRSKPSVDLILSILKALPDVDCFWLISGSGSMRKRNESNSVSIGNGTAAAVNVSGPINGIITAGEVESDKLIQTISHLEQSIRDRDALLTEREKLIREKDALISEKERLIQILLERTACPQ